MIGPTAWPSHLALTAISSLRFTSSCLRISSAGSPVARSFAMSTWAWSSAMSFSSLTFPALASASAFSASATLAAGVSSASLTMRSVLTTWTITLATDEGRITAFPSRSWPTRGVVTTRSRNVPSRSHGTSICLRSPANRSANQRSDAPIVVTRPETGISASAVRFASALDRRSSAVSPLKSARSEPAFSVSFQRFLNSSLNALFRASLPVTSVPDPCLERATSSSVLS